jgi:hypothetical protein
MREALAREIERARIQAASEPMVWGRDDCLMWLANIHRNVTGDDPGEPYRKLYSDEAGAKRVMGRFGVLGTLQGVARRLGWTRINPERADTGDWGAVMTNEGLTGVICVKPGWWCQRHGEGIAMYRTEIVKRAWRVL